MEDLKNPKFMWLKAGLFLVIGAASSALLLVETPTLKTTLLLALAVWAFCRAYYFAFYVIQNYIDPAYKFSGLMSFLTYVWRKR